MSNETHIQAYESFRKQVAHLEAGGAQAFDYETPAGNKAARSHVHALRSLKGAVEKVRKEEKAESLAYGRRVDAQARELTEKLDGFIAVHAAPLREIEAREEARVADLRRRLEWFELASACVDGDGTLRGSNYLMSSLAEVRAVELDDSWGEFLAQAGQAKDDATTVLEKHVAAALLREKEAAELERLREEREEAAKREEARRIAEAAEARAREAAETEARKLKEAHARAIREAEEKAEHERQEAARALKEQQEAAEAKAKQIAEAAARVLQEQREAAERRELELKLEVEHKERVRLTKEAAAQAFAEERRLDEENRARVHFEILEGLVKAAGKRGAWVEPVVKALAAGQIPHVTITY